MSTVHFTLVSASAICRLAHTRMPSLSADAAGKQKRKPCVGIEIGLHPGSRTRSAFWSSLWNSGVGSCAPLGEALTSAAAAMHRTFR